MLKAIVQIIILLWNYEILKNPEKYYIYFVLIDIYSWSQKFTYIHLAESTKCWLFYQVRRIIQNACYCLFSTDLNKIFHKKYVYM